MSDTLNNRHTLPTGYQLKNYKIQEILGNGNFGITYLAEDIELNTQVAIKEYFPNELAVREEDNANIQEKSPKEADNLAWGLRQFVKEAKTLALFKHPNIVHVLQFFQANNTAYIVMEYEPGQNMASFLKEKKGETAAKEKVIKFLPAFLEGLEALHKAKYLHQDIQPANIYLREKDQSPLLIDFGAARYDLANRSTPATIADGYAPIEQYQGDSGKKGPWTDIYSTSAVLYWLISGQTPVKAIERTVTQELPDPLIPAIEIGDEKYPQHFLEAIDWGLSINEKDRPQNVKAWRDKLFTDSSKRDKSSTQAKKSASTASGKSGKLRGLVIILVIVFLVVLFGGGGWLLYRELGKITPAVNTGEAPPELVPTIDTTTPEAETAVPIATDFYGNTTEVAPPPVTHNIETTEFETPTETEFEEPPENEAVITEAKTANPERETLLWVAAKEKVAAAQAQLPNEPLRIMTGAGVRLRLQARQNAKKSVMLQIGTIVSELEKKRNEGRDWYWVTTVDGDEGWVADKYTMPLEPEKIAQAYVEVAHKKLNSNRASFGDIVDLCHFLNEASNKVELDSAVELKLLYLKALQRSLDKIPDDQRNEPRYLKWVNMHKVDIVYQDTKKGWVIKKERFQQLYNEYSFLPIADQILQEMP
ncbi:serine/threonine protein kinase [Candidatus Parabeggiatoa sp. HSG14]|uniref:serine/threonine protein kinase n=1 Tax=Candidatus Parabeggiatoa sp. HSG14 TaxID=3055593 RepID=UPI0025A760C4|nr:serine/threonine protein kinase [Thiotrichales bacterium HSG14]